MNVTLPLSYTSAFEGPAAGACPVPWYYSPKSSLVAGISDSHFTLLFPVVTYWAWSAMYEVMDRSDWAARYRIHSLAFAEARNRATKGVVARAVLLQQLGQIILGYWWVNEAPLVPQALHCARADAWAVTMFGALARAVGPAAARDSAPSLGYFFYWWAVPILKIVFAMCVMDAWQYWLHRTVHSVAFLYKHFHSVHHRLYAPYSFGGLYNHPVEGFFVDTLGAAVAEAAACLEMREAALFFTLSMIKTVDDHCGYRLPFNPFHLLFVNSSDYHDIHHQTVGIKYNFSQPYFVIWDSICGTRMTREDMAARKQARASGKDKTE